MDITEKEKEIKEMQSHVTKSCNVRSQVHKV